MPSSGADDSAGRGPALTLLPDVRWHGAPVTGERTRTLLAVLAATPDEGVSEGRLIEELWGEAGVPANPTKALQVVVSRARTATSADAVARTPNGYRLGTSDTDLADLRERHTRAADAERAGDWQGVVAAARTVAELTISEAGEGRLHELRLNALAVRAATRDLLGRGLSALGHHDEALEILEASEPTERNVLALLRSEATVRGVPAALARYEQIRERYADELGVDPGPELQTMYAELLARDRPVREGLLYEASRLIGRDGDVAALAETIRTSRVTSIVGPGGLGKTRLAHLMGRLAEQPVVHFVELAGVTSPDGVAVEVGDVLGVREAATGRLAAAARRTDLLGRIIDQVGTTSALLILDNCEHLVDAVAELVQVLVTRTPGLRVLTTTRAPLGIAAERVYQLPQLGLDDAVELFVERASAARPGARLEPGEVRSLVARLDGLPLAVELAAAKVRAMSVAEIERRLEDRFALLRGGSREAPERHQTLIAVIDWSWNLLDDDERRALRRLSIFRDGFSLDAADAVVDGDALGAVSNLVDQSLVTVSEGAGDLRYRLLETVREFGQVQLVDAGDDTDTRERLRAWGIDLCRRAWDDLFGPQQVATMTAIRVEEGNLVDLLRRCLRDSDAGAVIPLMACLSDFWTVEGSHLKVVALAREVEEVVASAAVSEDLVPALRATLSAIAFNSMIFSEHGTEQALARLESLPEGDGETRAEAQTMVLLTARLGTARGDVDALDRLCEHPRAHVRQLALQWASQYYENTGDLAEARLRAERSLELVDDRDGPWTGALVRSQLAGLTMQAGQLDQALGFATQAIPVMEALGATEDVAQLQAVLAMSAIQDGRFADAARIFDQIDDDDGNGVFGSAVIVRSGRPELDLAAGRIEEGLRGYRDAVRELNGRRMPGTGFGVGYEPWVLFPSAAALSAHVRHGRFDEAAPLRADLLARAPRALGDGTGFLDYPVVGALVFALAEWELVTATEPAAIRHAVRLLVCADAFGYNRQLPSLSWAPAEAMAEAALPGEVERVRADLGDVKAIELREEVLRLVTALDR
ncbi:AAA family ATPase [Nocardioides sp. URHA0020]|uniref:AAA family ATPase n=1 Tax=Nocardioides sp. URHA0020 TaxID=1380392 RepID=UPI0006849C3C|nr:AAA family ATPase [Nocardioides sp. URHA0020]